MFLKEIICIERKEGKVKQKKEHLLIIRRAKILKKDINYILIKSMLR